MVVQFYTQQEVAMKYATAFQASSQVILQVGRSKGGKGSVRQDVFCTANIDFSP